MGARAARPSAGPQRLWRQPAGGPRILRRTRSTGAARDTRRTQLSVDRGARRTVGQRAAQIKAASARSRRDPSSRPASSSRKRRPRGTTGARGVPATPASRDRGKARPRDQRSPDTGSCLSPRGLPHHSRTKRGGKPPGDSQRSLTAREAGRENLRAVQARARGGRCRGLRRGARHDHRTTRTAPDREHAGRPVAPDREHHEHPHSSPDAYLRTTIRRQPPSFRQTHPARKTQTR